MLNRKFFDVKMRCPLQIFNKQGLRIALHCTYIDDKQSPGGSELGDGSSRSDVDTAGQGTIADASVNSGNANSTSPSYTPRSGCTFESDQAQILKYAIEFCPLQ
jgi:hypothetical protein